MDEQFAIAREELRHLFYGYRITQALYVVAELNVADLLRREDLTADQLAAETGAHGPSLARVLRLLASEGVFAETADGRYTLTPMAETLQGDVPGSLRQMVLYHASTTMWKSWGSLLHSVRTGHTAFETVHGVDFFEYFRQHPDEGQLFDQVMATQTKVVSRIVADAYDFTLFQTIVDVGGGHGALAIGLLEAHPNLRGIVFDQPIVEAAGRQAIHTAGLDHRCEFVSGDFFAKLPDGGDCYLLKFILHDWDDDDSITILRTCRRAIAGDGRLLVIELLIPPGNAPSYAISQDINMLVNLGGRERTEHEYQDIFTLAGFRLTRTIPVQGELHILEGCPE